MKEIFENKELSVRDRMHQIIDRVSDDKVKAMLILFQDFDEEGNENYEYPDDLKAQLDKDFEAYKAGEKTYSKEEVEAHANKLLQSLNIDR